MRTCVRVNSPCGCGLLLRLGRATRPAAAARAADDGRDVGGDGGELRGARVRHPQRDARDRGAAPVSGRGRGRAALGGLRRGERGAVLGLRGGLADGRAARVEEAFLEGSAVAGARLRADVRHEVGLPITVGVAGTKIAAKMASRAAKPDGLRIVDDERAFLHAHRVEQLWGIGKATAPACTRAASRRSARPPRWRSRS